MLFPIGFPLTFRSATGSAAAAAQSRGRHSERAAMTSPGRQSSGGMFGGGSGSDTSVGSGSGIKRQQAQASDDESNVVVCLRFSPGFRFLLACSCSHISLWSGGRERILLAQAPAEQGGGATTQAVEWRPPPPSARVDSVDSLQFVAVALGSVSVFQVVPEAPATASPTEAAVAQAAAAAVASAGASWSAQASFAPRPSPGTGSVLAYSFAGRRTPGQPFVSVPPCPSVTVERLLTVDVPSGGGGCSCVAVVSDMLFCVGTTADLGLVHCFAWDGGVLLSSVRTSNRGLVHMSFSRALGALGLVYDDGRAVVVPQRQRFQSDKVRRRLGQMISTYAEGVQLADHSDQGGVANGANGDIAPNQLFEWSLAVALTRVKATSRSGGGPSGTRRSAASQSSANVISFSEVHKIIAIGCVSGEVLLFDAGEPADRAAGGARDSYQFLRKFSLAHWDIAPDVTGAVASLEWSPGPQSVLCVGYERRGFALFSRYGCRLMCTISQHSIKADDISHSAESSVGGDARVPDGANDSAGHAPSGGIPASTGADGAAGAPASAMPGPSTGGSVSSVAGAGSNSAGVFGSPHTELAWNGVAAVAWGACSYCVCFAEKTGSNGSRRGHSVSGAAHGSSAEPVLTFRQVQFAKKSSASAAAGDSSLILLGDDRLFLLQWKRPLSDIVGSPVPGRDRDGDRGSSVAGHRPFGLLPGGSRESSFAAQLAGVSATARSPQPLGGDGGECWRHLPYPQVYLAENWPIRHLAVSSSGIQLAVAGRRGVALYNCSTRRWKLFGDANEEKQVRCRALAWYGDEVLVLVNELPDAGGHQLRFYPRTHLSNASLLGEFTLPHGRLPQFLDVNERYLILYTRDSFFYQYLLIPHYDSGVLRNIDVQLVHQVSMASVATEPVMVKLLPMAASGGDDGINSGGDGNERDGNDGRRQRTDAGHGRKSLHTRCLLLAATGTLALANPETCQLIPLAEHVEQFWLNVRPPGSVMGSILCAHGRSGLQIWFPFSAAHYFGAGDEHGSAAAAEPMLGAMPLMRRDVALDFDKDVFPTGFMSDLGVVVGISMGYNTATGLARLPLFEFQTKPQTFLHSVLGHLLSTGRGKFLRAMEVAREFSSSPHFSHALELLLHESLDRDSSVSLGSRRPSAETDGVATDLATSAGPSSENLVRESGGGGGESKKRTGRSRKHAKGRVRSQPSSSSGEGRPQSSMTLRSHGDHGDDSGSRPRSVDPNELSATERRQQRSAARLKKEDDKMLGEVVNFLRSFPQHFPAVVVRCARKTDSTYWPRLFQWVGNPVALFKQCAAAGDIEVAASYLLVLQVINGPIIARTGAIHLLELALERDDVELAGDLVRFIEPALCMVPGDDGGGADDDVQFDDGDMAWAQTEMLLTRYARKLLSRVNYAGLQQFSRFVRHDLRPWLLRERQRAAKITDWTMAFRLLHAQYNVVPGRSWTGPVPLRPRPGPRLGGWVWNGQNGTGIGSMLSLAQELPQIPSARQQQPQSQPQQQHPHQHQQFRASQHLLHQKPQQQLVEKEDDVFLAHQHRHQAQHSPHRQRPSSHHSSDHHHRHPHHPPAPSHQGSGRPPSNFTSDADETASEAADDGVAWRSDEGVAVRQRRRGSRAESASSPPPVALIVDEPAAAALSELLAELVSARCLEPALLVATMLLNVDLAERILRDNNVLARPYFRMLNVQQTEVYVVFRRWITDRLSK